MLVELALASVFMGIKSKESEKASYGSDFGISRGSKSEEVVVASASTSTSGSGNEGLTFTSKGGSCGSSSDFANALLLLSKWRIHMNLLNPLTTLS